jgi:hypothetical protein
MITPVDIKAKATRQYHAFLRSVVEGEPFFPMQIAFRKAKASDDYLVLRDWVQGLLAGSKQVRGFGYVVVLQERVSRRYGKQSLPAKISIETQTDFLRLIGKEREFTVWEGKIAGTLAQFPQLKTWFAQSPAHLLSHLDTWEDLLLVCAYFVANPQPNLYLRELPIPVHTKFIENHKGILRRLLDQLLPVIQDDETEFEKRYGLLSDEPLIRFRLLDGALQDELNWLATDLTLKLSDCCALENMAGRTIVIVENKMTFLTLPPVENGVAIFGGGYMVNLLRELQWLADCAIWYAGDLDVHGFEMLSQLRGYWGQTRSFLMDAATFEAYGAFVGAGMPAKSTTLPHLTKAEQTLHKHLLDNNLRLEQEHIWQTDVQRALRGFCMG